VQHVGDGKSGCLLDLCNDPVHEVLCARVNPRHIWSGTPDAVGHQGLSGCCGGGRGPIKEVSVGKKGFRGRSVTGSYLGSVQQIYVGEARQSLERIKSGRIDRRYVPTTGSPLMLRVPQLRCRAITYLVARSLLVVWKMSTTWGQ